MKTKYLSAALLAVPLLAFPLAAQARAHESRTGIVGREVAAPPWSFACTNDQGQSECGEPMWVYGSPRYVSRFKSAF
jgi:hypothetical protein